MDEITLLIFHVIVIGAVVATTFIIAFSAGKKEGIRSFLGEQEGKNQKYSPEKILFKIENII